MNHEMKIGFIGLGKMGGNMVERLLRDGHEVVVFNQSPEPIEAAVKKGAIAASHPSDLVARLPERKVVWLMVPSGAPVDENIEALMPSLKENDIIIDGGNSNWRETQKRADAIGSKGVHFIDCGTSGGVWGLENGYCLMYGGNKAACDYVEPLFKTLAPENGYLYCGKRET